MTEHIKDNDKELTNAAWFRLQEKLALEPKQSQWSQWADPHLSESVKPHELSLAAAPSFLPKAGDGELLSPDDALKNTFAEPGTSKRSPAFRSWLRSHRKWVGGVAAVCVLTAVIATPAGNHALASILNKFRMQQVTVVQENDLQALLNGAFADGKERKSINQFGTFTQASGKSYGEVHAAEATKLLGHKIFLPSEFDALKRMLYISPSNTITFKMDVEEVNKVMTRLGAKKLLPKSVDGKPITLEIGESIHLYVMKDENQRGPGYSVSQQPVPTITVDPSIPVSEALDAVLQFPLLPQGLKENLQTAGVLNGGSIPMPVISSGKTEKLKIEGTEVILSAETHGNETNYSATWVSQGQLLQLNGNDALKDRQAVISKVTELIKS